MEPTTDTRFLPFELRIEILYRLSGYDFLEACKSPYFSSQCTERLIFDKIKRDVKFGDVNTLINMYNKSGKVTALETYEVFDFIKTYYKSRNKRKRDDTAFSYELLLNTVVTIGEMYSNTTQHVRGEYLKHITDIIFRLVNTPKFIVRVTREIQLFRFAGVLIVGGRINEFLQFISDYRL